MNTAPAFSGFFSGAASLWIAGARVREQVYRTGLLKQRTLLAPVVSIGNVSWGGSGKTPFTIWLAGRLRSEGLRVSILTRGYRRKSRERVKVHPPGTAPEAARDDGDEVQIYLRHLNVPVGIAASRYEAGRAIEESFPIDLHILDDGFQHLSLARNVDIVLVDSANPWGSRAGFPYLLREGFSALRRAHAVVLTRCELAGTPGDPSSNRTVIEKLQAAVRSYNPTAPCFAAKTRLLHFSSVSNGLHSSAESFFSRRPLAFCAVGNPKSFFRMLSDAGLELVRKIAFRDHHSYTAKDLHFISRIAQETRADCLITTEKDLVNLPPSFSMPLPVYWPAIQFMIEDEERMISWLRGRLPLPLGSSHREPSLCQSESKDIGEQAVQEQSDRETHPAS